MSNYKETLASAIRTATLMEAAVVVKFWDQTQDFSECQLTSAVSVGAWKESFIVASVSGFPSVPFTLIVDPDTSKEEVVTVTAASSTTLTVTRGEDSTQAVAHSAGAIVRHMVIGRDLQEANDHIESTTTAHGLTLANVVTTTGTQTLTTKSLHEFGRPVCDSNVPALDVNNVGL